MKFPVKLSSRASLRIAIIVAIGIVHAILTSHSVFAAAGPGGGGGVSGCKAYTYSTCVGAVWRYYRSNSNSYPIKNIGPGYTYVSGCASDGGFFAYVLVDRYAPDNPTLVRSWKIGPNNYQNDKSIFFGGWTNYRVYSTPSDPIPMTQNPGQYSWYSVEKAFDQTKSLGQNSSYNWNGSSSLGWFCYQPTPLDFTLTPYITANASSAEVGSQVQLTNKVTNSGHASSNNSQWQFSQFVVPTGGSYPNGGISGTQPAQYYRNNLVRLDGGTGISYPVGDTSLGQPNETLPDYPAGYKVCYALSVQAYSNTDGRWAHSAPVCVTILVKPLVQVWGSDLSVGNSFLGTTAAVPTANVDTSVTTKTISGTTYSFGSWVEYGIFATGLTTNTGSAAAYAGTGAQAGLVNATLCSETQLSFNNAATSGGVCNSGGSFTTIGKFTTSRSIPDVASSYPISGTTPQFGGSNLSAATTQGLYTSSGDLTLTGGMIGAASGSAGAGRWVVINAPNATVTISGNITYTPAQLNSIDDIPQLIIIAKDINITGTVKNIDAWLIAKPSPTLADGIINTCSDVAPSAPLSTAICSNTLTINGPVMANRLLLRRTTTPGLGLASGIPAETINLRPDAYIWAAVHTLSNGRIETVYSSELPPRL
jgi:hypothetical protein